MPLDGKGEREKEGKGDALIPHTKKLIRKGVLPILFSVHPVSSWIANEKKTRRSREISSRRKPELCRSDRKRKKSKKKREKERGQSPFFSRWI